MKKYISILLCLVMLLLSACGSGSTPAATEAAETITETEVPQTESEAESELLRLTADTFPEIYGCESLSELGRGLYSCLTGDRWENAPCSFGSSAGTYLDLLEGRCGLALTMEIPKEYQESIYWVYSLVHSAAIAKEGLVIVVPADNPLESLTVAQLRSIYSGEVTNWAELGGSDVPVAAYHYGDNSGAQTLLEQQVLQGAELIPAHTAVGFPGILLGSCYDGTPREMVVSYENSPGAIGFTLANNMDSVLACPELKILQVENVYPDAAAIADGSYPLTGSYCAYITQQTEKDSPEDLLFRWLTGPEGQQLIAELGYIPAGTAENSPELWHTELSGNAFPKAVGQTYTTAAAALPERLVASEDYGMLWPYCGGAYHAVNTGEKGYSNAALPRYGFYDDSTGEPVTKACYTDIIRSRFGGDETIVYLMEFADSDGTQRWQFASADGSVITGEYLDFRWIGGYLAGIKNADGSEYDLFDSALRLCDAPTQPDSGPQSTSGGAEEPAEEGWEHLSGEVFRSTVDGITTLWNRATGTKLAIPDTVYWNPVYTLGSGDSGPVFEICLKGDRYAVVKGDLALIIPEIQSGSMLWRTDPDGEGRLIISSGNVTTMYAADCTTLIAQWTGYSRFYEDRLLTFGRFGCIVMDYSGNVLFCSPGGLSSGD